MNSNSLSDAGHEGSDRSLRGLYDERADSVMKQATEEQDEGAHEIPQTSEDIPAPSKQDLPPGWAKCHTSKGKPFFMHHLTRTATEVDPRLPSSSPTSPSDPEDELQSKVALHTEIPASPTFWLCKKSPQTVKRPQHASSTTADDEDANPDPKRRKIEQYKPTTERRGEVKEG